MQAQVSPTERRGVPVFHIKGEGLAFYNVLNLKGLCHGMTFFLMVYKVKSVFSVYVLVVFKFFVFNSTK